MLLRPFKAVVLIFLLLWYAAASFIPATGSATDAPFGITLRITTGLVVNTIKNLVFPDAMITGATQYIVVATTDVGAAQFFAQGQKNKQITRTVLYNTVNLTAPGSSTTLTVDQFTIEGPTKMSNPPSGQPGTATFYVGARATILPTTEDGNYTGTNTFRVVYN